MKCSVIMKSLVLFQVCLTLLQISASVDVELNSTLNNMRIAYSGQRIQFTCITRHSQILQWSSEEYIGIGGRLLELFSSGEDDTDSSGSTTVRRVNTYNDGGVPVIISTLHLTASLQYPTATVTCANNGHGQAKNITFQTMTIMQENVTLTTTLNEGNIAYPGQSIIFTCMTRNSQILQWSSEEYIGTGDAQLELFSSGPHDYELSTINPHTFARRIDTTSDNVPRVIVSELHLVASLQHPTATITCANNGHGEPEDITFQVTNNLEETTTNAVKFGHETETGVHVPVSADFVPVHVFMIVTVVILMLIIVIASLIVAFIWWHTKEHHKHRHEPDLDTYPLLPSCRLPISSSVTFEFMADSKTGLIIGAMRRTRSLCDMAPPEELRTLKSAKDWLRGANKGTG